MVKAKELRDQQVEELHANILGLRAQKYKLVNETKSSKKIEKGHLIRENRRDIARNLTVLNEKKLSS